jgi:hypothetical protein
VIDNSALENILTNATDISTVCEIYSADAVPGADGFDPHDALGCFAAVAGITFQGQNYQRLVSKFGKISKNIGKEVNTASVTFSNISREIAAFEFNHGFEGLIMVIRVLSRSLSEDLTDTKIEFAGRCDKPESGDKKSLTVSAKFVLGSLDVTIPRRKFGPDDMEGRVASDPEFEGFRFMPQYGTSTYVRREKKGGFLGWWNKKWVLHTLQYSSYSDLDAGKSLPEVFGRAQLQGVHIGYDDIGTVLRFRTAFCEGEIEDLVNIRSLDARLPATVPAISLGLVGAANGDDPSWVAPGYYSRTANIRGWATNSTVEDVEPAPDIVAVIYGRLIPVPTAGVWGGAVWSDDPAAQVRFLLTALEYYKLHENWMDDEYFAGSFDFNHELIYNTELADFTFVDEG